MRKTRTQEEKLQARIEQLESRLAEAEETLRAIHEGEVDALVIETATGTQIFTLKGAEVPYRVMVETMNEAAVTLIPNGTILYCNQRFGEMVETPLESIIGNSIYGFILPQGKNILEKIIKYGSNTRNSEGIDFQSAGGTSIPVLLSVSEINDGTIFSICLILTDITYQRRVQQDLQESRNELERALYERTRILYQSEERLKSVLDNSQDVIYRLNVQIGHYDYISPAAEKVTGYLPAELMAQDQKTTLTMIHPEDMPGVLAALACVEETGYADGNPFAVIDSEMPEILRRLKLWTPGQDLPVPPKMPVWMHKTIHAERH